MNSRINRSACVLAVACLVFLNTNAVKAQGILQFVTDSQSPSGSSGCPNSEGWYRIVYGANTVDANQNIDFVVTGSGSNVGTDSGNDGTNNFKRYKWSWTSSGSIVVKYYPYGGGSQQQLGPISFSMTATSAGTISGASSVCYGTSTSLSVTGNAGTVTWASRPYGGSTWTDMSDNSTGNLTAKTQFQARYSTSCGTDYSNIIDVDVTPLVSISGNMSISPTLRYVGDDNTFQIQASVSASNHDGNFTWTIKDGSNNSIASPSGTGATVNLIDWSSTFTGNAAVSVTAHGCNSSTATRTGTVTVDPIPTAHFTETNSIPEYHCAGTEVHYKLVSSDQNVTFSNVQSPSITGGGSNVSLIGTNEWSVVWTTDGSIDVAFSISKDGRTWTSQHVNKAFDVDEANAGTISFSGPSTMCTGTSQTSGTINIQSNSGTVTYWSCTSGCSSNSETGWTQMMTTSYSLSVNTSFRVKLGFEGCGVKRSDPITATIASLPTDILVNGPAGVCSDHANAKIVLNQGESGVKYRLYKNNVDTNLEITGPGPTETAGRIEFVNQGVGTYKVIATLATCTRQMSGTPSVVLLEPSPFSITTDPVQPISNCPGTQVSFEAVNGSELEWGSTTNDLSSQQRVSPSFNITPAATATYSVNGVDINCRLPVSGSVLVTVKPLPYFSDQQATLCSGQATNFTLSSTEGTTFTWTVEAPTSVGGESNSTSPLANLQAIQQTLTTSAQTQETIVYTIVPTLNSCVGPTHTATVYLKPTPQITVSNQNVFANRDFDITLSPTISGAQVAWTTTARSGINSVSDGQTTSGVIHPNLITSAAADGTITYVFTPSLNGCTGTARNAVITVFVLPVIQASINPIIKGGPQSTLTTVPTLVAGSGTWYRDDVSLITAGSIITRKPATYKIQVSRGGVTAWTESLLLTSGISGQNLNYVVTEVVQKSGIVTPGAVTLLSVDSVNQSIQYVDGLGRPIQSVVTQGSPLYNDVVQPFIYDQFGRESTKYLPYTPETKDGWFKSDAIAGQADFYQNHVATPTRDGMAFAKTIFEGSPLNRVIEQGAPGSDWQPITTNNTIKKIHRTNTASEVLLFKYNDGAVSLLPDDEAFYPVNSLYCTKTIDENQNDVLEFLDKQGRTVCKKVKAATNVYASTYYIYDPFGNLVVVIPPEGVKKILNTN